jgi:hypothetical protein
LGPQVSSVGDETFLDEMWKSLSKMENLHRNMVAINPELLFSLNHTSEHVMDDEKYVLS